MLSGHFWDAYFRDYDILNELTAYRHLIQTMARRLELSPDDSVLDVGSGTANLECAFVIRPSRAVCFDMAKEGLALSKKKAPWVETVEGDMMRPFPFGDAQFTAIASNNALYAVPRNERARVYREIRRVLKPGGKVVISNILEHFSPVKLYAGEVQKSFRDYSIFGALRRILLFLPPTVRLLYYNHKIKKAHIEHGHDFFRPGELGAELQKIGFTVVGTERLYDDQAELVVARL